jgi:hypothetical protein
MNHRCSNLIENSPREGKLYSTTEIAEMFGITDEYLRKLRSLRAGPVYSRIGRMIRYRIADVEHWLEIAAEIVTPERIS